MQIVTGYIYGYNIAGNISFTASLINKATIKNTNQCLFVISRRNALIWHQIKKLSPSGKQVKASSKAFFSNNHLSIS